MAAAPPLGEDIMTIKLWPLFSVSSPFSVEYGKNEVFMAMHFIPMQITFFSSKTSKNDKRWDNDENSSTDKESICRLFLQKSLGWMLDFIHARGAAKIEHSSQAAVMMADTDLVGKSFSSLYYPRRPYLQHDDCMKDFYISVTNL
jgi:hypothetical protein